MCESPALRLNKWLTNVLGGVRRQHRLNNKLQRAGYGRDK